MLNARSGLSLESRVLFLCSRLGLDAEASQALDDVLVQEIKWPEVLEAGEAHYIVPLLARHLLAGARSGIPRPIVTELRDRQLRCTMRALQLIRVQQQLVEAVFQPLGVEYAFFKGAALAQRYYGDPAQRQYRDVDVLVDARRIAEVGEMLLTLGYSVSNPAWSDFRQRELAAFCRYHSALEMLSPHGVLVELHRTIDGTGCIFSARQLLAASSVPAGGRYAWRMLAPSEMFVYLCYHHARHRWSSLHWCADLDALMRHPDFDLASVRKCAAAVALESTLEEALKLHADLHLIALGHDLPAGRRHSLFLDDCLAAIRDETQPQREEAGLITESSDAATGADAEREPDFHYPWQFSPRYRRRFKLLRWRPSANDVNAWPLPLALHWLYYFVRPVRIGLERLTSMVRIRFARTP